MFKHNYLEAEKKNGSRVASFVNKTARCLKSNRTRIFLAIALVAIVSVFASFVVIRASYIEGFIEDDKAAVQNEAVLISAEFTEYESLDDARDSGMYENLNNYSSLNSIRIRIIDRNHKVIVDTYMIDNGKTMVNSKTINMIDNPKTISDYNKKTGSIEAASPIYNNSQNLIGMVMVNLDDSKVTKLIFDADESISAMFITIITLIIVIAIIVSYLIEKPYDKMLKVVEDISQGYTDKRLDEKGTTELKDFATNFNEIMDKANKLDESRGEFVSNVSHELKTPITSIKVLADSLNTQENVPVELYREFMQDIVNEIDRENKIIEDLLAMVKMDKSSSSLNVTSVNVNELLEMVLKRLKPLAQKKNIEILFESFRPVVAEIDEVKMTQVISNLVENAIKYNNMDGWVHVSLNADHQYFFVRIEDSGIGIPKDSQNKVFERFYRVDKARSRETGGTGLGLSIVRGIILMHHGSIKLYSEEGQGTTFTFRIPLNYVPEKEN
ncbi:MAG: sensor histidine kinase [Lachnospira sp.]